MNHSMPEQSLAGIPAKWHRAMLNEKCKGESLSYPFTEHYPECILDARYTESLNSSKFLCACLSYPTLSECCEHLSSASLCLGLPNMLREGRSITSGSGCWDLTCMTQQRRKNSHWCQIGYQWVLWLWVFINIFLNFYFYIKSNNFCWAFIDFLSVKPLFQISKGKRNKR